LSRFIDGFPEVKGELLDHLMEPAGVLISVVAVPFDDREPLVSPLADSRVRDVRDLGGDICNLPRYRGWTKHDREPAIELVVHPEIECQASEHGGR
jgi:hypothetical protein